MFLNTIKEKGQRSFTSLFYFHCSGNPEALFAKTLLKMAKQSDHKGTVMIELKPCQHLNPPKILSSATCHFAMQEVSGTMLAWPSWWRRVT